MSANVRSTRSGEKILIAHGAGLLYARIVWLEDDVGFYWRTDHKRARSRWNGHVRVEDEGTTWLSGWWHAKARIRALIAGAAL